ncbi:triacylglycerol lipase [Purpureocillium lavendulum]|uniref:Carboxylic ester hydrolase n=1 Tax=Purpureocillium lavendulum TaxID=1247861 RepID=A0AB34FF74_9HYPO|nr:triacylglycerol lipase [Purpureocillium lavendulum]
MDNTFKSQSEDCLFLDVYAPTNATSKSKLPVYFFIQGGGFVGNSNPNYNGTGLVEAGDHGLIVVNFNYRVGVYGFLTDGKDATPNNGLWDQVKALEWVQKHIAKFGGDPKHVVIGGDSAGAASVSYHLTRGGGRDYGLFVGAAAESVSFSTVQTTEESQYLYDGFAVRAGCATKDSLRCLRKKSTKELQEANVNVQPLPGAADPQLFAWNPVMDGDLITELPYDAYKKGHFVRVPMNKFLRDQFPALTLSDLQTIDSLYPNANDTCPDVGCRWRQVSDAYGQMRYMCPGLYISMQYLSRRTPSWAYRWNVEDPDQVAQGLGVPHTVELHAIFGPENTKGAPASYSSSNAHAVTVAQGYWCSFIRSLDPNKYRAKGSAEWTSRGRLVVNTGARRKWKISRLDCGVLRSHSLDRRRVRRQRGAELPAWYHRLVVVGIRQDREIDPEDFDEDISELNEADENSDCECFGEDAECEDEREERKRDLRDMKTRELAEKKSVRDLQISMEEEVRTAYKMMRQADVDSLPQLGQLTGKGFRLYSTEYVDHNYDPNQSFKYVEFYSLYDKSNDSLPEGATRPEELGKLQGHVYFHSELRCAEEVSNALLLDVRPQMKRRHTDLKTLFDRMSPKLKPLDRAFFLWAFDKHWECPERLEDILSTQPYWTIFVMLRCIVG